MENVVDRIATSRFNLRQIVIQVFFFFWKKKQLNQWFMMIRVDADQFVVVNG